MTINVSLLDRIHLSQIKEGTFQTKTTELFRPPDCGFMEHRYGNNSALHLPILCNASIQWQVLLSLLETLDLLLVKSAAIPRNSLLKSNMNYWVRPPVHLSCVRTRAHFQPSPAGLDHFLMFL